MEKVNIAEQFELFNEHWIAKIVGEVNDTYVKLAKLKGEFVWHTHDKQDEMYFITKGKLLIRLRDKDIELNEGEFFVVPRGVEHQPVADDEVHVLLVEPKETLNLGNVRSEKTVENLQWF